MAVGVRALLDDDLVDDRMVAAQRGGKARARSVDEVSAGVRSAGRGHDREDPRAGIGRDRRAGPAGSRTRVIARAASRAASVGVRRRPDDVEVRERSVRAEPRPERGKSTFRGGRRGRVDGAGVGRPDEGRLDPLQCRGIRRREQQVDAGVERRDDVGHAGLDRRPRTPRR